jgi:hypothetical protein
VTVVEVLLGQLYLVTVLALVVANIGREQRLRRGDKGSTRPDRASTT